MTELERLTKRLFSDDSVRKLVNFKLFRGDDVTVTQEQLCAEINSALDQVDSMQPVKSLDSHLTITHINDFIKAK